MAERDRWVHVKVTADERDAWQAAAAAAGVTLSDMLRDAMATRRVGRDRVVRRRAPRRADPALLAAIGRAGNNLNQIAHWCNRYKGGADAVQVLAALASIEQILLSYRPIPGATRRGGEAEDADADQDI